MNPEAMYLAVAALPIVAGIYRYAGDRGRKLSPAIAFDDAWRLASRVGLICCCGLVAHKCLYGW